jgi:membrane associated rhomboid family serine protease
MQAANPRSCSQPACRPLALGRSAAHHLSAFLFMTGYDSSDDQRPITYFNGYPVYATTLLVAGNVVAFLVCALLIGTGGLPLLKQLAFTSGEVLSGKLWQLATYVLVHSPAEGLWFALEMLMLFWFGRQVEQMLGQRSFLRLYAILLLLPALVMTLVGLAVPNQLAGSRDVHFAVFVAFAAAYPGAQMMFGISAKWAAIILVGLNVVQALSFHQWPALIALAVSVGAAVGYIRYEKGLLQLPALQLFRPKPKFTVVRPESARPHSRQAPEDDELGSIDPLLDKIAKSGMSSLTAKERARLEKAREALMKRETPPR